MLEEMPEQVMQYWLAYKRLQDPEERQAAHWEIMDPDEFVKQQNAALKDNLTRIGKEAAANKN
jgi:hypothetical protein